MPGASPPAVSTAIVFTPMRNENSLAASPQGLRRRKRTD
jgi:hypothetical protein